MTEVEKLEEQKKKLKEKRKVIQAKEALLFYKFATTYKIELGEGENKHWETICELYKLKYENWLKARESKRKNRKDNGEKNRKDDVAPGRAQ